MFGRSKHSHIADADDAEVAEFEAGVIDVLEAFCGVLIERRWFFHRGGARHNAPTCPACAEAAGWYWDPEIGEWLSPYEEAQL
jgi:hypothetical protein